MGILGCSRWGAYIGVFTAGGVTLECVYQKGLSGERVVAYESTLGLVCVTPFLRRNSAKFLYRCTSRAAGLRAKRLRVSFQARALRGVSRSSWYEMKSFQRCSGLFMMSMVASSMALRNLDIFFLKMGFWRRFLWAMKMSSS